MAKKLTKIAICTPVYNNVDFDVYINHLHCVSKWANSYDLIFLGTRGSALVASCEHIAEQAIEKNCDYALFLDADHIMPVETLDCLTQNADEAAMISGLVCKKGDDHQQIWWVKDDTKELSYKYTDFMLDGKRYEVDICAFGCTLINISKLKQLDKPWFKITYEDKHNVGFDVNLCKAFRNANEKIYVDTRVLVGHHGILETIYPQSKNYFVAKQLLRSNRLKDNQSGFYSVVREGAN